MRKVKSCGLLLFQRIPITAFLLMKHQNRYDLPKGHILEGESELECALRELKEETGILANRVELNSDFRFEITYQVPYKRFNNEIIEKTLVIFLGYVTSSIEVNTTEHKDYKWIEWNPPHNIQNETIDSLLQEVEAFISI